jgi:hypothetical protein
LQRQVAFQARLVQHREVLGAIAQRGALQVRRHVEDAIAGYAGGTRLALERGHALARHALRPGQRAHMPGVDPGTLGDAGEALLIERGRRLRRRRCHGDRDVLHRVARQPHLGLDIARAPLGAQLEDAAHAMIVRPLSDPPGEERRRQPDQRDADRSEPLQPQPSQPTRIPGAHCAGRALHRNCATGTESRVRAARARVSPRRESPPAARRRARSAR